MQQRESIVSRFHDSTSRNNESRMFHKQKLLLWWCRLEEVNIVININFSKVNQEIKSNLLPFLKVNKLHLAIYQILHHNDIKEHKFKVTIL